MNLPINGRGKPRAYFGLRTTTEGVIRIDCDRDLSVWYEVPITRATLAAMLAEMDAVETDPVETDPEARRDEARRVADPTYTPTLDEALRNPAEFVDGMTEV